MKIFFTVMLALVFPFAEGWMAPGFIGSATAHAKKRYQGKAGANAPACRDFPRPAKCNVPKKKRDIYVTPEVCSTLLKNRGCYYTIGYRSCRTNSSIRGAARRSAHLCGKAADIRIGSCNLGAYHGQGSARHRHYQSGSCQ